MDAQKPKFSLPEEEEKILRFWETHRTFQKTLEKNRRGKTFVFYEGPPTANGRPGFHHALTRSFKDIILRYKTMRGFFVPRKAGWDTHGLPVEIEVEKQLGLKSKQGIEQYGIAQFNQKAKESVWKYKDEWERFTTRLGFWLDLEDPYVTYETSYIETLWWVIKKFWKKGLLYQDFKSVPWCPRCGTGLSSHEVGLGYRKVKDTSVYVKLKIRGTQNEYLLVWTTTPWTLPANVAIAVNPAIEYTKFKIGAEEIWSFRTPPQEKDVASVIEKVSGKRLVGIEYEPLYHAPQEYSLGVPPPYKVVGADFVSTEEGTGMVHIASAFGEDDLNLMKFLYAGLPKNERSKDVFLKRPNIHYPILHTVTTAGIMRKGIIAQEKFVKDADPIIIQDLKARKLLAAVESYEHDYPFCWRCATPLLYYARNCWWVKTTAVKDRLIRNNATINWIPEHLKQGRFGEFLREVRDWAFSRERYWGTPLPIWKCSGCGTKEVLESRKELYQRVGPARNKYTIMRHGEAENNIKHIISSAVPEKRTMHLTLKGRKMTESVARKLKRLNFDLIISSDFTRTRETAEIVGKALGIEVIVDPRLREIRGLDGEPSKEVGKYIKKPSDRLTIKVPGGETIPEVRTRVFSVLADLEKKYSDKTILLVSHEHPLWVLFAAAGGMGDDEMFALRSGERKDDFINFSEALKMPYRKLPRDETGAVNLHRPYVDEISFPCRRCRALMKRVPEVADVWFDSGSMPFAQAHFPFVSKLPVTGYKFLFPADYISEAVDQTRGWFYTLLVVATLLGRVAPYKNVISVGHVLDKNGQKMSKSKGNIVDPKEMMQKYGADALRWYFYTINSPGEPKRFDEKDLQTKLRSFIMTLWNSFILFDTYVDKLSAKSGSASGGKTKNSKFKGQNPQVKSKHILDRWVISKLNYLTTEVTNKLDQYDITGAARIFENFIINDFSQWYLRRSRRRLQHPKTTQEGKEASETIAYAILVICTLGAPFIPFITEAIFGELRKKNGMKGESIHLLGWPKLAARPKRKEVKILEDMRVVREIVAQALRLRSSAGIKVRQPLRELRIKNHGLKKQAELLQLIKDEANVKEISFGKEITLDTVITPELKEEGMAREFIRNVQEMRRDLGLKPNEPIRIQITGSEKITSVFYGRTKMINEDTNSKEVKIGGKKIFACERELEFDDTQLWLGIDRA